CANSPSITSAATPPPPFDLRRVDELSGYCLIVGAAAAEWSAGWGGRPDSFSWLNSVQQEPNGPRRFTNRRFHRFRYLTSPWWLGLFVEPWCLARHRPLGNDLKRRGPRRQKSQPRLRGVPASLSPQS